MLGLGSTRAANSLRHAMTSGSVRATPALAHRPVMQAQQVQQPQRRTYVERVGGPASTAPRKMIDDNRAIMLGFAVGGLGLIWFLLYRASPTSATPPPTSPSGTTIPHPPIEAGSSAPAPGPLSTSGR
ncbi:hypothetical protein MVLG_01995 [Microbotryum lychnidis-dioicae p1A1 Lamole]|uniref:Uncharacterized protein n=1 Tax=Microbotryum lychnidis-dioicae (strain p1A1 Lamole / MvSl-1064) TaxID=683840 RepID=U5H3T8_USTV1|nr:hypothetical protein MVLG_01995 [Microbotryum lychnidis-dioicae p1A1 Lamole]|eukprot:KDE07721.1 hypothetical protein MVLG_01995 [Microbotryum lychnidis-dioicae p1A1 Lamole]